MGSKLKRRFTTIPPLGEVWDDGGFVYEVIGTEPHTNRDGTASMLIDWRGQCAECGDFFKHSTGASVYYMARRCKAHNQGWTRATPYGTAKPAEAPKRLGAVKEEAPREKLYFPPPVRADQRGFHLCSIREDGALVGRYGIKQTVVRFVWHGSDNGGLGEFSPADHKTFLRNMARELDAKRAELMAADLLS